MVTYLQYGQLLSFVGAKRLENLTKRPINLLVDNISAEQNNYTIPQWSLWSKTNR